MKESSTGITVHGIQDLQKPLVDDSKTSKDSLFRDDIFELPYQNVQGSKEARVIQDITLLIVLSCETLASYGSTALACLIERVNEGGNKSTPVKRPDPNRTMQSEFAAKRSPKTASRDLGRSLAMFCILATSLSSWPHILCSFLFWRARSSAVLLGSTLRTAKTLIA